MKTNFQFLVGTVCAGCLALVGHADPAVTPKPLGREKNVVYFMNFEVENFQG